MRPGSRWRARRAHVTVLGVALAALLVAGCGSDDSDSGGGGEAAGGGGDFKIAMLLGGNVEGSAYNTDAKNTADEIEKKLGADVTISQSVSLPNQADVYGQFARQGYDLLIGWGGEFTDGAAAASKRFPDTEFLVINSTIENGKNLSSMDLNVEQWHFVAGYASAKSSKSGTVGWIGGQCFPATAANLNGTKQGAEYANKDVKFLSTFTGNFEDPTKAQLAADGMIDNKADSITANLDRGTVGVIKAAQTAGDAAAITEWIDSPEEAPDATLTSVLKSQTRPVLPLVEQAMNGKLGGKHHQIALPKDWGPAIANTALLPDDVYEDTLKIQDQVANGEIKVKRVETCPK
jgi:basic membrane protein A and related proteins